MEILTSGLESFFWFVIVLGIMIFVHEFGHFIVAKSLGITVEVFSLGFGPRLFGRKAGETDYRVCALPLGGYVRMKGENPDEALTGDRREFLGRPKWQRALVLIMGPALNVVLAVAALSLTFMNGVLVDASPEGPATVEWVVDPSPASSAGIALWDRIVAVNGKSVATWKEVGFYIALNGDRPLTVAFLRDGQRLERTFKPVAPDGTVIPGVMDIGVVPHNPAVMDQIEPGSPAAEAGFQPNDRIVKIGDTGIWNIEQAKTIIRNSIGTPLAITVDRGGTPITLNVAPIARDDMVEGKARKVGVIGFKPYYPVEMVKLPVLAALRKSVATTADQALLLFRILGMMVEGQVSVKNMSGPIEIAKYSREAARTGTLLPFIAFISLQLGIINLLPIPVLDGGHLFILLIEGIVRREFSLRIKERIMQAGMVILMALMVFVIVNDLAKVKAIKQILPW